MCDSTNNPFATLPGILILTHGPLGPALLDSARLVMGDEPRLMALPLLDGCDISQYAQSLEDALSSMGDGTLVLADLFGGTPFNQLVLQMDRHVFWGVAGVNLPMLIEAASMRYTLFGQELADAAEQAGQTGIASINTFMEKVRVGRTAAHEAGES